MSAKVLKIASGQSSPLSATDAAAGRVEETAARLVAFQSWQKDCLAYRAWGLMEVLSEVNWPDEQIVRHLREGASELKREREAL